MSIRNQYDQSTLTNMGHMNALKERQTFLEEQNEALAEENDALKAGAMESLEMMTTAKELQKDIESQSNTLADRAQTIRKLLEENNRLNKQL